MLFAIANAMARRYRVTEGRKWLARILDRVEDDILVMES
jgi:hypothetical protein